MAQQASDTRATTLPTLEQIRHLADEVFLAAFNAPSGMKPEGVLLYRHAEGAPAAIDMLQRMERALIRGLHVQETEVHPNLADVRAAIPLLEGRLAKTCEALEQIQGYADVDDDENRKLDRLLERRETLEWVLESLKAPVPSRSSAYVPEVATA